MKRRNYNLYIHSYHMLTEIENKVYFVHLRKSIQFNQFINFDKRTSK